MIDLVKYFELGGTVVVSIFALWCFLQVIKMKKTVNGNGGEKLLDTMRQVCSELKLMNENHLNSIQKCIAEGNAQLIKTIHDDNMQIISHLSNIEGRLSK